MEIKNTNLDSYRVQLERNDTNVRTNPLAPKTNLATQPGQQGQGDRVSVSPDALLRTETFRQAMSAPDVRQEKVNAIKERVDTGTYQIDSRRIASKLVQSELALFRK